MRASFFPVLLLVACDGKGSDSGGAARGDVSFSDVQQVFSQSCAFSSCHGDGEGDLTLGDGAEHSALVGVESAGSPGSIRVVAGDADQSYLIQKMEGASGIVGDPMPPTGSLDNATIQRVRAWIDSGALED